MNYIYLMGINVCPIATVNASLDHVWEFLSEPKNFALWWEAQTQNIVPEGRAHAGQKIHAKLIGFGKSPDMTVTVNAVDESKHQLDLTTQLPFGITVYSHITCTPHQGGTTQVSFG